MMSCLVLAPKWLTGWGSGSHGRMGLTPWLSGIGTDAMVGGILSLMCVRRVLGDSVHVGTTAITDYLELTWLS